jgi:isopentenyl-diphosphate delta-isomerase type 1
MTDELLDLVDDQDNVVGEVWKHQVHGNPKLIHREVAIAVFNDKGEVLLQQRSYKKENDPGAWKMSAAGHVGKGEDPKEAVIRELSEELGIVAHPIFYKKIFRKQLENSKISESRFFWIYYAIIDGNPEIKFDIDEVADARWVKVRQLEDFSRENTYTLNSLSHKMIMELANKLKII